MAGSQQRDDDLRMSSDSNVRERFYSVYRVELNALRWKKSRKYFID